MLHLIGAAALGTHEWPANFTRPFEAGRCVPPGQCTPPKSAYSKVITGPVPGQQWNINGGFCGAFSVQHAALAAGALRRRATHAHRNRMRAHRHRKVTVKSAMTLAGLEPAIFGSEDQRLIH